MLLPPARKSDPFTSETHVQNGGALLCVTADMDAINVKLKTITICAKQNFSISAVESNAGQTERADVHPDT